MQRLLPRRRAASQHRRPLALVALVLSAIGSLLGAVLSPSSLADADATGLGFVGSQPPQHDLTLRKQRYGAKLIQRHMRSDSSRQREDVDELDVGGTLRQVKDMLRNVMLVGTIGGVVGVSWYFTGKWWKLPLTFALPSMVYRLWATQGNTEKLAAMSASVDMKYVATTEEQLKELRQFMCSECGYTLFPARGREAAFFTANFVCPMCKAPKSSFMDMSD